MVILCDFEPKALQTHCSFLNFDDFEPKTIQKLIRLILNQKPYKHIIILVNFDDLEPKLLKNIVMFDKFVDFGTESLQKHCYVC